jgi:FkbM family methyltransferase
MSNQRTSICLHRDEVCNVKPIFSGSFHDSLVYLRTQVSKYERSKIGSIVVDNVVLFFADLHSFYFEMDQIFTKQIYGYKTEERIPVIIDCGAHVGLATLYFSRRFPQSKIHAFEADPDIHTLFQANIQSAKLNNVTSHAKAVWTHNTGVHFMLSGDDSGHISQMDGTLIPSVRLKDYLEQFERIDMLKLDVEGAEFEILEDCLPVLDRVQRMIVEVHRLSNEKKSLGNLLGNLEKSGFEYVLSDLHSASWTQVDHVPPFDFVTHDKFILTVFAWRPTVDIVRINQIVASHTGKPNVAQFCMQDYGGAGTAALRLHDGLFSSGMNSTFYVQNIQRWKPGTVPLFGKSSSAPPPRNKIVSNDWKAFKAHNKRLISKYPQRPQGLEIFTDTWAATKLSEIPDIAEADVIHLHWIAGTVDISREVEFLKTKKIVWTLHDMNAFTGGCHYAAGCQKYKQQCGNCPQLGSSRDSDLSRQIWTRKMAAYKQLDITIVALCQWMADCVKKSSLLSSFPVHVIPNGLPTDIFKPYPQVQIRESLQVPKDAFVILFGADSVANVRKGFVHLLMALEHLKASASREQIALATFGKHAQAAVQHLGFPTFAFDYVDKESELALVYSMADVTVIPSLEDNLPNVVLESLACGTPVVGFDVGGIPDMVEHQVNGYLARVGDDRGLAEGMQWVMERKKTGGKVRLKCRETALSNYNLPLQAGQYRELYEELLATPMK